MRWWIVLFVSWVSMFFYSAFEDSIKIAAWEISGPEPYHSVEVLRSRTISNGYEIAAEFVKNGVCELRGFSVVGYRDGIPEYLGFLDRHGLPPDYDRDDGEQFLWITVNVDPSDLPDFIELRTRHDCGGPVKTSRVFLRVDLR